MFALNHGEVCTCPSPALLQESTADPFLEAVAERTDMIVPGNPGRPRRGIVRWLLRQAHHFQGRQQDADLPEGGLRTRRLVANFSDYGNATTRTNDTIYDFGAGLWSCSDNTTYWAGWDIRADRVRVNNHHAYPAYAAFGG